MAGKLEWRRSYPADARIGEWMAADGWSLRTFDWRQPAGVAARGSMLFQGGRGDVFEKYLEAFRHWHARGWNITSFDWRGQGGSGRCSPLPHAGHIDRFARFDDDLRAFWVRFRTEMPGPHVLVGHSMGGFLALNGLVAGTVDPDAAVLVAPMLGLKAPIPPKWAERLARLMRVLGDPARPAWKGNERPATTETRQALLTHDADRYADEIWWQEQDPRLMTGPPSWNWLVEAFASTRRLRDDPRLAGMRVPVLALIADIDGLVDPRAAHATLASLPDARVLAFGREAAHELLREADPVRDRALAAIDTFLQEKAPN